jgi:hypothetical protein
MPQLPGYGVARPCQLALGSLADPATTILPGSVEGLAAPQGQGQGVLAQDPGDNQGLAGCSGWEGATSSYRSGVPCDIQLQKKPA